MIHQLIFAGPKPGLSAEAFQSYWINFHAKDYAAKISQIKQYLVATHIPINMERSAPFFEGVAEIWLKDDKEQLLSLQSPEFLQGARIDEPRWAAFWQTFVHDADSVNIKESAQELTEYCKLYVFLKRQSGIHVFDFKTSLIEKHAPIVSELPTLKEYKIALAREGAYEFGEPRFDAIEIFSFANVSDLTEAINGGWTKEAESSYATFAEEKCLFRFAAKENWIIRPGDR